MNTTANITRAQRQASVTTALERATKALRGIGTGHTPPDQAHAAALRYCRATGISAVAIDAAALAFLASPGAAVIPIEELDAWLFEHAGAVATAEMPVARLRRS